MSFFNAIVLSLTEGITEFLPISSTGHLILTSNLLKIEQTEFVKSFEIIIQLGAILGIVFLYWKTLIKNINIWKKIIIAFIPTALIGFLLYKTIKQFLLGNAFITLIALFAGGIALIVLELLYKEKEHHLKSIEEVSSKTAFLIGLAQSISIVPGVSRSAATIISGLFLGLKRKTAAEFSFLLAIPTIAAASGLDLVKSDFKFTSNEYSILAVGFIGAFFVAILTVKLFLNYIKKHNFVPFGIYRIMLAILFWIFILR